jgi:hypothetical protein
MEGLKGVESLVAFMEKKAMEIEVVDAIVVSDCQPGKICNPEAWFCQIERCRSCGKIF